jgi:hypothetical protein
VTRENGYRVQVEDDGTAWRVTILDPVGAPVAERVCGGETEARIYASTVNQHIDWLSDEKFRRYYRLPDPEARSA